MAGIEALLVLCEDDGGRRRMSELAERSGARPTRCTAKGTEATERAAPIHEAAVERCFTGAITDEEPRCSATSASGC